MTPPVLAPPGMLRRIAEAAETPALKMVAGSLAPEIAASIAHAIIAELGIKQAEASHVFRASELTVRPNIERVLKDMLAHEIARIIAEGAAFSRRPDTLPDCWRMTARAWVITKGETT